MIHPTAHIGPNVIFVDADDVVVGPHASIIGGPGSATRIDRGVVIGPGARIGQAGFGYVWDEDAGWSDKPHHHGVVIEHDVHIGANTCIDRGSWRDTYICTGTRIDNLVHIAHNVFIGENCCIVAGAEISGSAELAGCVYVAPNASIRERLKLGPRSVVGLGAVVTKDVKPCTVVAGVPARELGPVTEWPPPPPRGRE